MKLGYPGRQVSPTTKTYELLDFGDGRKLERFHDVILDRPSPAAIGSTAVPSAWDETSAKYERRAQVGKWRKLAKLPARWRVRLEPGTLELRLTKSGQVGVFPEQERNWHWVHERLKGRRGTRILNLFSYTGASTMAAAAAGAEVVHVDAAQSVVSWARRNAALSGLGSAPIRWIVEDAAKFARREINRGHAYDGIILDPPSYGHGPKGENWKLSRDLMELLVNCKLLLANRPALFLLTCHTPGFGPAELSSMVTESLFGTCAAGVRGKTLVLTTSAGKRLAAGAAAYWP